MSMRDDRQWPPWHPDQELRAQHLLGLEDYLLSRAALADGLAHGVERFDWRRGIALIDREGTLTISLSGLVGVTPAQEPVWIGAEPLETVVSLALSDRQRPIAFDVWVDINPRRPGAAPAPGEPSSQQERPIAGPDPAKLVLAGALVVNEDTTPEIEPGTRPHSLYVGRYRWDADAATHELVHPPLVRRLGSLAPHDAIWHAWIEPLADRIDAWLEYSEQRASAGGARAMALASEAMRLAIEWPVLPVPALGHRLGLIARLSDGASHAAPHGIPHSASHGAPHGGAPASSPSNARAEAVALVQTFEPTTGPQLPQALAALLPEPPAIEAPAVVASVSGLPGSLAQLLDALALIGDVHYHAPAKALRAWAEELARARAQQDAKSLIEQVQPLLQERLRASYGAWSRAVMLVTSASLETAAGDAFPRRFIEPLLNGGGSLASTAAESLSRLYRADAQEKRAGPMAFYWLARAAEPAFSASVLGDELRKYFRALMDGASSGRSAAGGLKGDRVLAYVTSRANDGGAARSSSVAGKRPPERGVLWQRNAMSPRQRAARPAEVRIVVVGPSNAGKTELLRKLCREAGATGAGAAARIQLPPDVGAPRDDGLVVIEGSLDLATQRVPLSVIEVPGPLLDSAGPSAGGAASDAESAFQRAMRQATCVIVALDPLHALGLAPASQTLDVLRAGVERALRTTPGVVVAMAYTKADEYGVIAPQALRVIAGTQADHLNRYVSGTRDAWDKFAAGGGQAVGEAMIGARESEWTQTRARLLERTRTLWDAFLQLGEPPPLLNAYFVAAASQDPLRATRSDCGLMQLVADYAAWLQRGAGAGHA
jgi:hypothetical protein